MAAQAIASRLQVERPPLFSRLMSWLGGAPTLAVAEQEPLLLTRRVDGADQPPLDKLVLAQWLWGAGFHIPGGEEHVLELVKPFALNPAMSMLDVAAGLGGPARAFSNTFKIYLTAYERDPAVAKLGAEMSTLQGMSKHAPVTHFDPETFELRPAALDCILGRQATYTLADKERFLTMLAHGLKPRGQLMLTEFVVDTQAADKPEFKAWERRQPAPPPQLWTLAQYTLCLTKLGFDIRITEETTARYRSLILQGWAQLLHHADLRGMPRKHVAAIINEAESWMYTIAALDSGALKLFRLYALAPNSPPPTAARKGKKKK
jgi:ubiquinone/menaquinone biosynthesis C-methylase UbiE